MRISDWSSDVCSSDLSLGAIREGGNPLTGPASGGERAASRIDGSPNFAAVSAALRSTPPPTKSAPPSPAARPLRGPGPSPSAAGRGFIFRKMRRRNMSIEQHIEELRAERSEEHTSELQSLMRISYAVLGLKK